MIIYLRDKSEIYISQERGEKLKEALVKGTAPEFIAIDDELIRRDFIVRIKNGGKKYIEKQIAEKDYRGEYSPELQKLRDRFSLKK